MNERPLSQFLHHLDNEGHLGGFLHHFDNPLWGDPGTWAPEIWNKMIKDFDIKSVVDIGCALGHSTLYFSRKNLTAVGIEGSPFAIKNAIFKGSIIKNDYIISSGLTDEEFDLAWAGEFVEHVEEKFMDNFLSDFKHCKHVAMTHAVPGQPGHHHVNCKDEEYWIEKLKASGFKFEKDYTKELRAIVNTLSENKAFPHAFYLKTLLFFTRV